MNLQKLPVFLTVDTEIWPFKPTWPESSLEPDEKDLARQFDHYIMGTTRQGEFGLRYQMARLSRHGLRATFFVEALHAAAVGEKWLTETIGMILEAGHDVQMHVHTEWLSDARDPALPPRHRQFIREFPLPDQVRILAWAKQRLKQCGVNGIRAFRAGNFGANLDTLTALSEIGVPIDSSYSRCFMASDSTIDASSQPQQRCSLGPSEEFPATAFIDYPNHFRPAQLAACSSAELERALLQAWDRGWHSFVMVWHSNELLQPHFYNGTTRVSAIVVRRLERLCNFLAHNRDKFETMLFGDVRLPGPPLNTSSTPLNSSLMLTAHRMVEQAIARYL
jgi:peptidoglycan/xylan/chitin deacetylase (PgdA/CDA1 family)